MKLQPVGDGSLLALRYFHLLHTPRVLRWGLAQSLLAIRLRRRSPRRYYTGQPVTPRPPQHRESEPSPIKVPDIEPTQRFWPSDRLDQEMHITIESAIGKTIALPPGTLLDIWT